MRAHYSVLILQGRSKMSDQCYVVGSMGVAYHFHYFGEAVRYACKLLIEDDEDYRSYNIAHMNHLGTLIEMAADVKDVPADMRNINNVEELLQLVLVEKLVDNFVKPYIATDFADVFIETGNGPVVFLVDVPCRR